MISSAKQPRFGAEQFHDEQFLKMLPDIERHARFAFRSLRVEEREEGVCEAIAHAFCAFRRLAELNKQTLAYATSLARFAVARVRAGRRVGTKLNSRDVFSVDGRRRHSLSLKSLDTGDSRAPSWLKLLADTKSTPIPAAVAFRLDFSAWLRGLCRRDRNLIRFLAVGNMPSDAAQQFQVSKARISQLRSWLHVSWQVFQDEAEASNNDSQTGAI